MSDLFRLIPSVDLLLAELGARPETRNLPRSLVRRLVGEFLDDLRLDIRRGGLADPEALAPEALMPRLAEHVLLGAGPRFRRVVNATGVVVHTNLGRSILPESAIRAVEMANARYSNLEFNLDTGERGSRYSHVEDLIRELTGAEAALVVNNNAAAVLLVLDTLAKGREAVVSRGQLVEIGGSFRIPDVMAKSGAVLREVGTTNRTHPKDYEAAINEDTALLMKVHCSNFKVMGFTREVSLEELRAIGDARGLPVYEDMGSGNLFNFQTVGLGGEPTVQQVLAAGADVVSFSGDKVLGGPQAGVIAGREKYVSAIKANPLNRALRIDKMTLAALEATLRLYLDPAKVAEEVPTLRMITASASTLAARAGRLARALKRALGQAARVSSRKSVSRVGGGAFPVRDLPTSVVAVVPSGGMSVEELKARLLSTDPPVAARIEHDALCLDVRTLQKGEQVLLVEVLGRVLS